MTRPYRGCPTFFAPIVGAVHRAALMPDIRKTKFRAARCTAPTGVSENFRAHRRGGFPSLPRRWITGSADLLYQSDRSGTVTVKERIDPFPTGVSDDRRTHRRGRPSGGPYLRPALGRRAAPPLRGCPKTSAPIVGAGPYVGTPGQKPSRRRRTPREGRPYGYAFMA